MGLHLSLSNVPTENLFPSSHLAVRHAPHNPEYRLSLAFALSRSSHPTDLDASLDAFFNLHRDFPSSPYGVIGLVHLGRQYYERGRPEERAHVGEALRTALEALGRLRLVPPEEREGGRWYELDELERFVIQGLREMDLGEQVGSPVLAEVRSFFSPPSFSTSTRALTLSSFAADYRRAVSEESAETSSVGNVNSAASTTFPQPGRISTSA